jgi:hypothetical protein
MYHHFTVVVEPFFFSTVPPVSSATLSSDLPRGTIAAFALGGVLGLIAVSSALYAFLIYRPRVIRRRRQEREEPVMNIVKEKKSEKDLGIAVIGHVDHVDSDDGFVHPYSYQPPPKACLPRLIIPSTTQPSPKSNSTGKKNKGKKALHKSSSFTLDLASASQGSESNGRRLPPSRSSSEAQSSDGDQPKSLKSKQGQSPSGSRHVRRGSRRLLLERDIERNESEEYSDDDEVNDLPTSTTAGQGWPRSPVSGRSVRNYRSSVGTFGVDHVNDAEQSRRTPVTISPVLQVRESSPFRIDFLGLPWWGGSKESANSNGSANRVRQSRSSQMSRSSDKSSASRASMANSQRSGRQLSETQKGKDVEVDVEKNNDDRSQIAPREAVTSTDESFLNLSPVSKESSVPSLRNHGSWRPHAGQLRSHWSESTGYSVEIPSPSAVPPLPSESASIIRHFSLGSAASPPSQKSSQGSESSSRNGFPYPISIPNSPFTPDPRPAVESLQALQPSTLSQFITPFHSNVPITSETSGSSGDSVPTTISDIHFRHPTSVPSDTQPTPSSSMSTGSLLLPHPPLPTVLSGLHNVYSRPPSPQPVVPSNLDSEPYIVQRVLGHARTTSAVTLSTPSPLGVSPTVPPLPVPGTSSAALTENPPITDSPRILSPTFKMRSKVIEVGRSLIDFIPDKPRGPRPSP